MGYQVIICICKCYVIQYYIEATINIYNLMSWWIGPLSPGLLFDPKWSLHNNLHYHLLKNNQMNRKIFSSHAPVGWKIGREIEGKIATYLLYPVKSPLCIPTNAVRVNWKQSWYSQNKGIRAVHRNTASNSTVSCIINTYISPCRTLGIVPQQP